jgi:FkbM family methyltransferase
LAAIVTSSFANRARVVAAILVVNAVNYIWQMVQLHLRRSLPRVQHVVAMRVFRLFGRSFPVRLTYPNPVAPTLRRLTLDLDLCSNHSLYVRARQRYEVEWLRLLAAAMPEAECFVDVGAHVGVYALTLAQAFPDKRVIAVEPLPANFAHLTRGIALNGLTNLVARQAVVTEASGRATFHVSPLSDANGSLVRPSHYQTGDVVVEAAGYRARHAGFVPTLDVEAVRLEDLVDRPAVVKVDVEGGEAGVLRSGAPALAKGLVDLMVVEVQGGTYEHVLTLMDDLGFEGFLYGHRRPLRPGQLQLAPYRVVNVLFLRRGSPAYDQVDFS